MSFINTEFFLFLAVSVFVYYLIYLIKPIRQFQWVWLLVISYYYYLSFGFKIVFFILFTTLTTYAGALLINKYATDGKNKLKELKASLSSDEKKAMKAATKKKKRRVLIGMLILNFGMLGVLKYANFAIENINGILHLFGSETGLSPLSLLLPIGISFYTFQSMGYIIDVYMEKYEPEKNPFRFALFVSFFPQIMQGPIGRFNTLAKQLYSSHSFDLRRIERGLQLIMWGIAKKMIIADRASVYVNTVFGEYYRFCGWYNIVAILLYAAQLYADFSGGMDIVLGCAEMLGIKLDQNFRQPFFSKSVGEFWRRWHITLGAWMKDYIFYPFSLSKIMGRFSKFLKKNTAPHLAKVLPICVANLLIFFIVGVWHGAEWKFIAYGIYNGVIIAFSALMEPYYARILAKLHINSSSKPWKFFQIIRTALLMIIGFMTDVVPDMSAMLTMLKDTVYQISFDQLTDGTILGMGMKGLDFLIVIFACIVVLIVSILKEKGHDVRDLIEKTPLPVRWAIYLILVFSIPMLGYIGASGGFIYAQF